MPNFEPSDEQISEKRRETVRKIQKNRKRKKHGVRDFFVSFFATLAGIFCICAFLMYGPFPYFRNMWVITAMGTGQHQWLATMLFSQKTINEILAANEVKNAKSTTNANAIVVTGKVKDNSTTLPASGDINVNTVTTLKGAKLQEVDGPQLVRSLQDVDIAVINGNYAMEGDLSLAKDALATESPTDNPNVNILVWNSTASGDKLAAIKKLDDLLHSDDVRQYIESTWSDGSVIPAF